MVFAYWVVHGSVDWLWEYPGLGGPAFALLGVAVALAGRGHGRIPAATLPLARSRPAWRPWWSCSRPA